MIISSLTYLKAGMAMPLRNRKLVFLLVSACYLFISIPVSYGQWYSGTGFFINGNGFLLTNYHLVEKGCSSIIVDRVDYNEKGKGEVIAIKPASDLALIKTDIKNDVFSFIRMKEGYKTVDHPSIDEQVHTLGFPDGKYGPRGGVVTETHDPLLGEKGITIGMSTDVGASGSPVLDVNGLLVGIVWGGRDYEDDGGLHINVYAIDNKEIFDFLIENKIKHGSSTIEDFPLSSNNNEGFFDKAKRVISHAHSIVSRVYCKIE